MTTDPARSRAAGFTMVEMMAAIAVFSGVLIGVGVLLESSSQATDYLTGSSELDHSLQKVIAEVATTLKCAPVSLTTIDETGTDHDSILVQLPDPSAVSNPDYGYFDVDGSFVTGWYCLYFVNGDEFTKRRLDATMATISDQVLCGYVDSAFDDGSGSGTKKGFRVTTVDSLVTVELRLFEAAYSGDQRRSVETSILQVSQ